MDAELIPWTTRNEWIRVYKALYSKDFCETRWGVQILTEWKYFMKHAFRPGMDCTRSLLQIALKDKEIFVDSQEVLSTPDLQLMYSAETMRFLNLVCDSSGNVSGKKMSLYAKARGLGIPDWVVNIRHQMAHRGELAHINILRMALQFILDWLKENYWEIEKNGMREEKLEDPRKVVTESLNGLLSIYILMKEQIILGSRFIRNIQDPIIRDIILDLNSYSLTQVKLKCKPWEVNPEEKIKCSKNLILAIFSVIKMMKPFLKHDELYGVDTMSLLVKKMIDDSVDHNGLRREIWKTLLKSLHSWHKFPLMISLLVDKSYETSGEQSYQAGMWSVELCQALQKRYKVELFTELLIKEVSTRNTKEVKQINFDSRELIEFTNMLRERKLDISDDVDEKRLACLYMKVEDMYKDLKEVLRLREPIFPDRWEVIDLLNRLTAHPTLFTEQCLVSLNGVLNWPYSKDDLNNLVNLTKLYRGEGIIVSKKRKVYSVENIAQASAKRSQKGLEVENQ